MNTEEKTLGSKEIFKGRILDLYVDEVLLPTGKKSTRELIRHCKASAVLAVDDDGKVILEKQFRYPYKKELIEIPAGKCEKDEDPKDTAIRELEEETGYRAGEIKELGYIYPSCAYTDEIIYIYLATELKKTHQHLDEGETLSFYKVSVDEFLKMIKDKEIEDAKTIAAGCYYLLNR